MQYVVWKRQGILLSANVSLVCEVDKQDYKHLILHKEPSGGVAVIILTTCGL